MPAPCPVLAPYASDPRASRGRRHPQPPATTRTEFQRDRDRVVHSNAFRRLAYKTQVFLNHEGDLFRTRLTHSIEVAQIGRSIARGLRLNEDLVEAIALAHDLGHTPFGHAGQEALHQCLKDARPEGGGFEHNFQSLRVVDRLEERYPTFDGLNLCFETREGILKHCSRANAARLAAADPCGIGQRFLDGTRPGLEAQLCNLADAIAYNAHDLDDGVRAGLLDMAQLLEVPPLARLHADALRAFPRLTGRRLLFEMLRRMLARQIGDVIAASHARLRQAAPRSADEARQMPVLIALGEASQADHDAVQRFLRAALYRHPGVMATTAEGQRIVRELFDLYRADPREMSPQPGAGRRPLRDVADYIAGMTDRFALAEHHRLTGRRPDFAPWPG